MNLSRFHDVNILQLVGLLAAMATLGIGIIISSSAEYQTQLAISVFVATIILWITKPVPYAVSSLFSVILLYALDLVATFQDAVIGFASTLIFFFILLLLIGQSVAKVNLDDWVATQLVSTTSNPRISVRRLTMILLLLAFLMPSAVARTVTFMPIIDRINDIYDLNGNSSFRRLAYYVIGHVNPLASLVVMTGGGMAITTSELINSLVRSFTWIEWVMYMAPPITLLYVSLVVMGSAFYRVGDSTEAKLCTVSRSTENPSGDRKVEPLTSEQQVVVVMMVIAIAFWIIGSFIGIPAIIPAMVVVLVFSLPGLRIIGAEEFKNISWGIVFLMGTMLSLIDVMQNLGAFDLLIDVLFIGIPMLQFGAVTMFLLFVVSVSIRSTFSSVSAAILLLMPILLEFAAILELKELYVSLSVPIVLASAVFLPFNSPTVLLSYERGPLTRGEVAILGVFTMVFGFLATAFGWFVYWPMLDQALNGLF